MGREKGSTFVYHQGDSIELLERLNGLHNPRGGLLVVNLPPGVLTTKWVEHFIVQALGQQSAQIRRYEGDPDNRWDHWIPQLGIKRLVLVPSEGVKPETLSQFARESPNTEFWLAARHQVTVATTRGWDGCRESSFKELEEAAQEYRPHMLSSVDSLNYAKGRWPKDLLKARFESLLFPILEVGTFTHQFTSGFWAATRLAATKKLSRGALARLIRISAGNQDGTISSGAYCGIWSSTFRSGQTLKDPWVYDMADRLAEVSMPRFHELPTIEYPLVFGLVSAGFSLGEINALRLEQVRADQTGGVRLLGADVSGDLAEVLKCAVNRRTADRPDNRLLWTSLVATRDLRFRAKTLTREQQLRQFYRVAAENFRRSSTKKGDTPPINKTLKKRLSEIVPDIPAAYVESPLSERDFEILRTGMHESGWPAGVVRGIIEPEDDVSRLVDKRYIEEVPPNGIVVDQGVLLSQGFASTKHNGLLLERARVEALRANGRGNVRDLGRRSEDLLRIQSVLDPGSPLSVAGH